MPEWLLGVLVIGGALVGGLVLMFLAFYLSAGSAAEYKKIEDEILTGGRLVKCWVVVANPALHKRSRTEVYNWCQVVFTFETPVDLDERLARIADRVRAFQPARRKAEKLPENERLLASVMTTNIPYAKRIRLPDRLAEGLIAYTVSLAVLREHLPGRRLTLPYLFGKALPDEESGDKSKVVMVRYPEAS